MHPERRIEIDFHPERRPEHDKADDQDHENDRPVAGIGKGIVEAAIGAARCYLEKAVEQPALPASGATSLDTGGDRFDRRIMCLVFAHGKAPQRVARPRRASVIPR